nr:hypothetical protein [Candidatus Aenigmarchaeota archaeon]
MRKSHLLTLAFACFILFASVPPQIAAWVINPTNKHLYGLISGKSWWIVEAKAIRLGGHLAAINSREEELWLRNQFGPGLWIGLNDLSLEGKWEWNTGEPVTYTNWCYREPNNGGGNPYDQENVARLGYPDSYLDCWFDVSGNNPNKGIIEISKPEAIAKIIQENFNGAILSHNE